MEYKQRIMKEEIKERFIYPHEYEQASNSYLMAVISVMAGLPLPIINLIAAVGYYLGNRKSTYFVRWHCIQSIIGQALLIPFNSIAFGWTVGIILNNRYSLLYSDHDSDGVLVTNFYNGTSSAYWLYIYFIVLFNLIEFIAVIYTAAKVRKGHNVRWPVIAGITDKLTSKENRDIYTR